MAMKKQAFISKLADESGLTRREANDVFNAFLRIVMSEVMKGEDVALRGFGTFRLQHHKGHAVSIGKKDTIDGYYVLKFRASETLNKQLRAMMEDGVSLDEFFGKSSKSDDIIDDDSLGADVESDIDSNTEEKEENKAPDESEHLTLSTAAAMA